jgi:hypothetical protein
MAVRFILMSAVCMLLASACNYGPDSTLNRGGASTSPAELRQQARTAFDEAVSGKVADIDPLTALVAIHYPDSMTSDVARLKQSSTSLTTTMADHMGFFCLDTNAPEVSAALADWLSAVDTVAKDLGTTIPPSLVPGGFDCSPP